MNTIQKNILESWTLCSLFAALCFLLNGCDSVKKTMGMSRPESNPYLVVGETPLIVPPGIHDRPLPEPQPGVQRPQKRSSSDAARSALMGHGSAESTESDPVVTPAKGAHAAVLVQQAQTSADNAPSKS